ncbi:SDR family oxidoreductase [Methanobacterium sp.]|uniref:SDR family oxidoreductase n=1 Tax=Methanobacterium sp. TaxID=2164 RepID=UPI003C74652B
MKNKKVAVTGGLGFIGSHLVEKLSQYNEVVIVDNESTGKIENINHLDRSRINIQFGDINSINLHEIFEDCEYVFHEAAIPSIPRSINDPLNSNKANITGTLKVLVAASELDIKKVIFASSSSVYGDIPTLPKVESMPVNPKSPYAVTKAACEHYCTIFKEIYGLQTISLRYFNVFGPRQNPYSQYSAVIPKFITSIINGNSPTVYGDGLQSRDFTFVKNVVDANILAAESNKTGNFNIACGKRIKLNDLIYMINKLTDAKINPVYVDPRPGDIKHSLADISKAKSLGYNPKADFKNELKETIKFFRSNPS